jgi:hypothetical protein
MQPSIDPAGRRQLLAPTLQNLFYPPEKNQYTYFEPAASFPFAGGTSLVRGAWAADASMLAYARFGSTPMAPVDLSACLAPAALKLEALIGDLNTHGTQAYFATNKDFAILAFRGTEKDDPIDQLDDADLFLVPESDHRPVSLQSAPAPLALVPGRAVTLTGCVPRASRFSTRAGSGLGPSPPTPDRLSFKPPRLGNLHHRPQSRSRPGDPCL